MMEGIHEALAKREEQANRVIANLRYMDRFRLVYTILSFFDADEVEKMANFHAETPLSNRLHFQTAAGMLIAAGYDIQNRYVPSTMGGCLFAKKGGTKWPLDITQNTINMDKVEYLVKLEG